MPRQAVYHCGVGCYPVGLQETADYPVRLRISLSVCRAQRCDVGR